MIEENNKIIAEFMEMKNLKDSKGDSWDFMKTNKPIYTLRTKELKYHSNWSWIMPVVEKIENIPLQTIFNTPNDYLFLKNYPTEPKNGNYYARFVSATTNSFYIADVRGVSKIEAVYNAVVEFIKWYNQKNNQQ